MIILGTSQIGSGIDQVHDNATALIRDGEIIAVAEEERFDRMKHSNSRTRGSLRYILEAAKIKITDIDLVAMGNNPYAQFRYPWLDVRQPAQIVKKVLCTLNTECQRYRLKHRTRARMKFVSHHDAHAACAYYTSGFDTANVLIVDNRGECETFTFYAAEQGRLREIWKIPLSDHLQNSIGGAYTDITGVLRLGAHSAGKLMGLASYGKSTLDLSSVYALQDHKNVWIDRKKLRALANQWRRQDTRAPFTEEQKNLAASIQSSLENIVVALAREAYQFNKVENFVFAGGVALNCNVNSKLLAQDFCKQLHVPPQANDSGIALGAALYLAAKHDNYRSRKMATPYLGPEYSNQEVETLLKRAQLSYRYYPNVEEKAAQLICSGRTVGWFQGRMEIGPRALGNRSILADPAVRGINDRINIDIKERETWRPFAPSVTHEAMLKYFSGLEKIEESPFMLFTFLMREEYREKFPAIVHVDGSSRLQTVKFEQNPRYYRLLKAVESINGHPLVLNTSFNGCSEPIVCTPKDALACFFRTGLDALVIQDFVLEK